jgi:hypothetical protein
MNPFYIIPGLQVPEISPLAHRPRVLPSATKLGAHEWRTLVQLPGFGIEPVEQSGSASSCDLWSL